MIPSSTWRHLYRTLQKRSCILILGPHIATFSGMDGEEQLMEAFSQQLVEELRFSNIRFDETQVPNLAYTSLRWMKGRRMSSSSLREEMRSFFDQSVGRTPKIYRHLAQLPFFLVVNTSPDSYMEQAFLRAGKTATALHYNYQRNQAPLVPEMSVEEPVVFNLFGSIEDLESLVISKEDQVDFINNLLKNVSTLPNEILQHFDQEKTYLFLGFDADDWHLPLLFRSLRLHEAKDMSFYLHADALTGATRDFYIDSFDFQFVPDVPRTFAQNLLEGYQEWEKANEERAAEEAEEKNPKGRSYIAKPQPGVNGRVNLLMMTANPKDTAALELNDEIDVVEESLAKGLERRSFFFKPILNTRKERLLELLLRHKPQIVHFSGHGLDADGLLFYGSDGQSDGVGGNELASMFKEFTDQISCIILNACYSETQAQVISQYIPNVIGSNSAIGDQLAIRFSEGFYTAIFAGQSYEKAYNLAMAHVGLQKFPPGGRPVFYKNGEKYIAE